MPLNEPMFLATIESHVVGQDIWEIEHWEFTHDIYKVCHTKMHEAPYYNIIDMGSLNIPRQHSTIEFPDIDAAYAYIDTLVRKARKR